MLRFCIPYGGDDDGGIGTLALSSEIARRCWIMRQCSYKYSYRVGLFETQHGCCPRHWLDGVISCVDTRSCWLFVVVVLCFSFWSGRRVFSRSFRLFFLLKKKYVLLIFSFFSMQIAWCAGLHFVVFCPRAHCGCIPWPNRLSVFAMCISVSLFVTTEPVSLRSISTDTGCAGCRWEET